MELSNVLVPIKCHTCGKTMTRKIQTIRAEEQPQIYKHAEDTENFVLDGYYFYCGYCYAQKHIDGE